MTTTLKLAALESAVDSLMEKRPFASIVIPLAILTGAFNYGLKEVDNRYWHPKFCQEQASLVAKPSDWQTYANRVSKVGEANFWGMSENLKQYSARLVVEELSRCADENRQTGEK